MSLQTLEGIVTQKLVRRGTLAHFKVDVSGQGQIVCRARWELFDGGMKSGYIPHQGDSVVITGNMEDEGNIKVYTVEPVK